MRRNYVLDSYAALTYLKEEPGWQKVSEILWAGVKKKATIFLNCVNLGEVYYAAYREYGAQLADQAITLTKLWPLKLIPANEEIALAAGRIKAENKLSYADAFVVATALLKQASIVTGDKEFRSLEDFVEILWLPKNKS